MRRCYLLLLWITSAALSQPCAAQDGLWTASGDALLLRRSTTASQRLAIPGVPMEPQWNAGDMHFDYAAGGRLDLARQLSDQYQLEVRFWGIDSFGADKVRTGQNATVLTPTPAGIVVAPGDVTQFRYGTDLYNGEVNLRADGNDWLTLLGGFRWMQQNESFDASVNNTAVYSINSANQLYGFQLGCDAALVSVLSDRLRFDGMARAGIYHNSSTINASTTGAFVAGGSASGKTDHVAFVGEAGLVAVFEICEAISARAGYEVFWLDGLATAPHQVENMNTVAGTAAVNASFSAIYHGGFFGIVGKF